MRTKTRRPLGLESLEAKAMLAGDVSAVVVDGDLTITGDEFNNHVAIAAGAAAGEFVITGLADDGGGATTVNGASDALVVSGVTGDVTIEMGDGDDTVQVASGDFAANLTVNTGAGADVVLLGDVALTEGGETSTDASATVAGNVFVNTGEDDDQVAAFGVEVEHNFAVNTGDGADQVSLGAQLSLDGEAETPASDDAVHLAIHGTLFANLGQGDDELIVQDTTIDRATVLLDVAGTADVALSNVTAGQVLAIFTGDGDDALALDGVAARNALLHTGEGADAIEVHDSVFTRLGANLGGGDDTLVLGTTSIGGGAVLHGGQGVDTLTEEAGNTLNRVKTIAFEPIDETPALLRRLLGGYFSNLFGNLRRR